MQTYQTFFLFSSGFTLRSMIHFELIFAYGARYDQLLIFFFCCCVFCIEVFKFSIAICCPAPHDMWDLSS